MALGKFFSISNDPLPLAANFSLQISSIQFVHLSVGLPVYCVEKFMTLNLDICRHRGSVAHGVQKVGMALNVEPRFIPKTFTENSNFSVTSTVSMLGEFIELSRGRQLQVW